MNKVIIGSNLKWGDVDCVVLSKFVALIYSSEEISREGLSECIPQQKIKTTLNSWINPREEPKRTNGDIQFIQAERDLNPREKRKMIALAVAGTLEVCM